MLSCHFYGHKDLNKVFFELKLLNSIKEEDEETGTEKPKEKEEQNNRKVHNIAQLFIAHPLLFIIT